MKGAAGMRSFQVLWKCRISRRATVPGLCLYFFFFLSAACLGSFIKHKNKSLTIFPQNQQILPIRITKNTNFFFWKNYSLKISQNSFYISLTSCCCSRIPRTSPRRSLLTPPIKKHSKLLKRRSNAYKNGARGGEGEKSTSGVDEAAAASEIERAKKQN